MSSIEHKYIAVAYELYSSDEEGRHLVEKAPSEKPFNFISGFGLTLEDFEKEVAALESEQEFDFTLAPSQAYGEYFEDRVISLGREEFEVNGRFDHEHIKKGTVIPLQNEEGQRFMGVVLEINEKDVVIDLNHPLAGKSLNFKGKVVESRPAQEHEITQVIQQLSGGCGGCGGCGGDGCDGSGCGGDDCGGCGGNGCDGENCESGCGGCGCGGQQ